MKKTSVVAHLTLSITTILIASFSIGFSNAAQDFTWHTTTGLPTSRGNGSSVAYNGRVYIVGGERSYTTSAAEHSVSTVYFATMNPDGTIGTWQTTTQLPSGRSGHATVTHDDKIYVIGGIGPYGEKADVWYASISSDGTIGQWLSTTQLPHPHFPSNGAVIWNGRIYVAGGWSGSGWVSDIWYADVNPDGSLGNWMTTSPLPEPRHNARSVVRNGIIYVIGGEYGHPGNFRKTVYYAQINSDGTLGAWSTTTSLPSERWFHTAVILDNIIYVIGGWDSSLSATNTVYYASIKSDGTIESWLEGTPLPERRTVHFSVVHNNRIYVIGGSDGTTDEIANLVYKDTAYYSSELIPPSTPIWEHWWFWAIIVLSLTAVVLGLSTIRYRHKLETKRQPAGTTLTASSPQEGIHKVCPNCGAQLPADSMYCGKCGRSLK